MAGGEIFRRGQDGSHERAVVSGQGAARATTQAPGPARLAEQFRDRFVTSPDVDKIRDLRVKIETMSHHASRDVAAFESRIETARHAQTLSWTPPAWKPTHRRRLPGQAFCLQRIRPELLQAPFPTMLEISR